MQIRTAAELNDMNAQNDPQASRAAKRPLFTLTQGAGDTLVCLHSSTGSHAQWRTLVDAVGSGCAAITPDLHDHGRSPAWRVEAPDTLDLDAYGVSSLLPQPAMGAAAPGVHLVGHSYGGAVALQLALGSADAGLGQPRTGAPGVRAAGRDAAAGAHARDRGRRPPRALDTCVGSLGGDARPARRQGAAPGPLEHHGAGLISPCGFPSITAPLAWLCR